jgi:hypothetical protein
MVLLILGIFIGIIVLYFSIVTFYPGIKVPQQSIAKEGSPSTGAGAEQPTLRQEVSFEVRGTSLSAWLYLPDNLSSPVSIIPSGISIFIRAKISKKPSAPSWNFLRSIFDDRNVSKYRIGSAITLIADTLIIGLNCCWMPDQVRHDKIEIKNSNHFVTVWYASIRSCL